MTEFSDVIKQFKRMCNFGNCSTATGCPMNPSHNIGQCRKIAFERPAHFAATVMRWAAEHPEPVYPTWHEWLSKQGILSAGGLWEKAFKPIPADIAEKLGLEPKGES